MIIHSSKIYMEDGLKNGFLEIEDGRIKRFYQDGSQVKADIDYGTNRIIPGIFDTHNHGCMGYNLGPDATVDDLKKLLKGQASLGVVNYLPTTDCLSTIEKLADLADEEIDGSKILGIHSEGPWGARVGEKGINLGYPAIDMETAKEYIRAGKGKLVLMDIAPEVDKAEEAIRFFVENGVNVAMFHTNANYAEANAGVDWGVTVATHLGNVMTGLHHRDVGTLGCGLLRDEVDCEMICDGLHVSLPMIQIYLKVKDHDKLMMISDNVSFAGAPVGKYTGSDKDTGPYNPSEDKSDRAYLHVTEEGFVLSETGRLSGSAKPVIYGIKNLVEKLHVPMEEVCKFFSYNPIRKYSDPKKKGALNTGKDADFVVISDDYDVIATWSEGRKVYDRETDRDLFNPTFIAKRKVD